MVTLSLYLPCILSKVLLGRRERLLTVVVAVVVLCSILKIMIGTSSKQSMRMYHRCFFSTLACQASQSFGDYCSAELCFWEFKEMNLLKESE